MPDYEFPWGDKFWLSSITGTAKNVKLDKRNRVYTTTRHETHSTSGYDYISGHMVNGSVTVPVNDVHTETDVESSFWIVNDKENKHFSFDHEVAPMLDGHRISVVWGALKGTERGTYKYIYNHNTGVGTSIPKSFGDLGLTYPSRDFDGVLVWLLERAFLIGFVATLYFWFFRDVSFLKSLLVCGSPSALIIILLILTSRSYNRKVNIIKSRANYARNIIVEYVKKL